MKILRLLSFFLLAIPALAMAATSYVSDQLVVTLRDSTGSQYKILESLRTDAPVEVLGEEGRFLRVRSESGTEGYVLRQYITSSAPKSDVIKSLRAQNSRLEQRLKSLAGHEEALSEERQRREELEEALAELRREYRELSASSGEVMEVIAERDRLRKEVASMRPELERLAEENSALLRSSGILWFLAGGGVLFVGWLLGKISRKGKARRF